METNMNAAVMLCLSFLLFACMDNNDAPDGYVYGNSDIGDANTTIADLKSMYAVIGRDNGAKEIENIVLTTRTNDDFKNTK